MFLAAFASRSCRVPQDGHCHVRVESFNSPSMCPQAEQVFELGKNRSMTTSRLPHLSHLQASMDRNADQPQSEMALVSVRLRTIPDTVRSSTTIVS